MEQSHIHLAVLQIPNVNNQFICLIFLEVQFENKFTQAAGFLYKLQLLKKEKK